MITVHGSGRSHGRAVGGAGAVVAEGCQVGAAALLASAAADRRRTVFRVRTGVPWRDVPAEYGPWSRVYDLFRRWQR
ncbi:transposase, partial [Streptomyces fimicarius]|uniref:transposase n=1 Tax=Streptomyces griseus TaxID=1911 RepID=UPI00343C1021